MDSSSQPEPQNVLKFATKFGEFEIRPAPEQQDKFELRIAPPAREAVTLGSYHSIQEAFKAVVEQRTCFLPWDSLAAENLPHRVHDIVCWKFDDFSEQGSL